MRARLNHTFITLLQGDITKIEADGIVNAANAQLRPGGGVDGAIHRAGGPEIKKALREYKDGCPTGSAVVTTAGNLPAKVVIHAVGPVWRGGRKQESKLLGSAYSAALQRAEDEELRSIAFPAISTGIYGYPLEEACEVAFDALLRHVRHATGLENILFVLFSRSDFDVYAQRLRNLIDSEEDLELVDAAAG